MLRIVNHYNTQRKECFMLRRAIPAYGNEKWFFAILGIAHETYIHMKGFSVLTFQNATIGAKISYFVA